MIYFLHRGVKKMQVKTIKDDNFSTYVPPTYSVVE